MKVLSGAELVGYIKERQAKQVRALRQADKVLPRLAIVQTIDNSVIDTYVRLKRSYGEDILIDVDHHNISQDEAIPLIERLNNDLSVHGIIVQLPLADTEQTTQTVNAIAPHKDVDGLGRAPLFDPATALAINWLCAGYNIDLSQQNILIIGQGRLVGSPLTKMWRSSGYEVTTADISTKNLMTACHEATLIVSATGVPSLITSEMVRPDTVVIDAGVASENGVLVGDIANDVYERQDISLTPRRGGVGPLTIAALFDNVIRAARKTVTKA